MNSEVRFFVEAGRNGAIAQKSTLTFYSWTIMLSVLLSSREFWAYIM